MTAKLFEAALGGVTPTSPALGRDFDVLDLAGRRRDGQTILAHAFNMQPNSLANLTLDFCHCGARRYTAWKIRNVGRVVALGLLNHDGIAHTDLTTLDRTASGCCSVCQERGHRSACREQ